MSSRSAACGSTPAGASTRCRPTGLLFTWFTGFLGVICPLHGKSYGGSLDGRRFFAYSGTTGAILTNGRARAHESAQTAHEERDEHRDDRRPTVSWGESGQPYPYQRTELVEPDWTRFPGWRDVTAEEWASAQWQRAHCVKNIQPAPCARGRPGRRALLRRPRARPAGARHHVDAGAAADDEHDGAAPGAGRSRVADRSALRRPDPPLHDARSSPTAAPTGRRTRTPPATRCTSTTCGSPRA